MKKALFLGIFLFLFAISPLSVLALGQITESIVVDNAMRGQEIHKEIIIMNTETKTVLVEFSASGQVKDWVRFYMPNQLENPIATATMEARKSLNLTAVFSVPADLPNGEYKGAVSVTKTPDASLLKNESSASISERIDRSVTIKISDKETISLEASVIPESYDVKTNEPLSVRVIYDNQSNISLSPSISFKIKQDEKTLYNVIYPYPENEPAVKSMAIHEIPALEIPTMGLAAGDYNARLGFMRGDKTILEKDFSFTIGAPETVIPSKIGGIFKFGSIWLLWLLAILLIAVLSYFVKKNSDIRREIKKSKIVKIIRKRFKLACGGITSLF